MKTQKVLQKWGTMGAFRQLCQEPYLEPNQKSMMELFCKNSLLFLQKKRPTVNIRLCCL